MNIICDQCGKMLHMDECGFHNDNYEDFAIYFCPYCGVAKSSFLFSHIEEIPSMPKEMRMPEKLLNRRLEKRGEELKKKMIEMNDNAIAFIEKAIGSSDKLPLP